MIAFAATLVVAANASCVANSSSTGNDAGGSSIAGTCSTDGTDKVVGGTFVRQFGPGLDDSALVLTADCGFCSTSLGQTKLSSNGERWTSRWNPAHDRIIVDSGGVLFYFAASGSEGSRTEDLKAPYVRKPSGSYTCDGVASTSSLRIGKLDWQRSPSANLTWREASDACTALDLDGSGWRLPTLDELLETAGAGGGERAFGDDGWFWTSTFGAVEEREAWAATTSGAPNANRKSARGRSRCVR